MTEGEAFLNELFLIGEDRILQMGTAVGGRGVTSMLVSDLDQDGESELLFTFSSDTGTYQSRIEMYAPGYNKNLIYEPTIAFLGDLGLAIDEDGVVAVRIVEPDEENLKLKYLDTLGNLALRKENDGLVLALELNNNLSDDNKSKLVTGQVTSDCQVLDSVQSDILRPINDNGRHQQHEIRVAAWSCRVTYIHAADDFISSTRKVMLPGSFFGANRSKRTVSKPALLISSRSTSSFMKMRELTRTDVPGGIRD